MIDEDFYFEESNPKRVFLTILTTLFLIGISFGAYYYFVKYNNIKLNNITVELGNKVPSDIKTYIKSGNYDGYNLDISNVYVGDDETTISVGEYSYTVSKGSDIHKGKIIVKDTTAPIVEVADLTVGLNEEFEVDDFIISCTDLSEVCVVDYIKDKDAELKEEGTYDISISIKDKYGNEVIKKVKLTVSKDASLNEMKKQNTDITNIYPIDEKWDKTYTVKFDKAMSEEDGDFEEKLLELTTYDFSSQYENEIKEKRILTIYNKYNLVLGLSIRLEFATGEVIYVQAKDIINTVVED